MPKPDTVIEAGDEVLLVLDPGLEEAITAFFAPNGNRAKLTLRRRWPPGVHASSRGEPRRMCLHLLFSERDAVRDSPIGSDARFWSGRLGFESLSRSF